MLLQNKNAVIYGGGVSLAGAVAHAMAREGAAIYLAGRNTASLEKVKEEIIKGGGKAEVASVNTMDESSVNKHIASVVKAAGRIDVAFNLTGIPNLQNVPLTDMRPDDFVQPITYTMTTQFLTSAAVGRVMLKQRSGVILTLTATPGGIGYPLVGGFGPACAALENFSMHLASELGPHGIRVVNIRSGGSPDSRPFAEAIATLGEAMIPVLTKMEGDSMLKKLPLMEDIANTAVFLASYLSAKITGVTIDVTGGTITGMNNRMAIPLP